MLVLTIGCAAQQYNVTATPAGNIKLLPNGATVKTNAGGVTGQIQWNNTGIIDGFTTSGDVTIVPSTGATVIGANVVTNAKSAQMAGQTIKGNNSLSTANAGDLSVPQTKALLAITTSDVSGLGSMASQNSNSVNISGGIVSGANVTGLAPPVLGTDAVNLNYVSGLSAGITPRTGVAVASTANLTLSGEQTIDGVVTSASRILVKNQSSTLQNGIYVTAAGAWSRASDSNTAAQLKFGYYYFVSAGTTQAATSWFIATAPTVLNTDPVVFSQFSASQSYLAGTGLTLTGNSFSLNAAQTGLAISASTYQGVVGGITPDAGTFTTATVAGSGSSPFFRVTSSTFSVDGRLGSGFNSSVLGLGTVSAHNVAIYRGNAQVGLFTASGLDNTVIGGTTPAAATVTTLSSSSNANIRTTKGNFNVILNVKDFGALGDGSTNDTVAIVAAIVALPSTNAVLYFPAGTYVTDTMVINGKTGLTIFGDGNGSSNIKNRTGGVVAAITVSTGVTIRNLTFDGNCSVRTAGQTAITLDVANNLIFTNNTIKNAGQYNILVGGGSTQNTNVNITNNVLLGGYADGINLQYVSKFVVANNTIDGVDDDCIAIGYNASGFATQGVVSGNFCRARNDLGTNTGRGIWVGKATDILIVGNNIDTIKQSGIWISDDGTGTRPARISVKNNKVRNTCLSSGHGIVVYKSEYITLEGNTVENPAQGNCIEIADWSVMTIKGGVLTQSINGVFCRGIHADESAGWSANWYNLSISDVDINMIGTATDACIYIAPDASVTMQTGLICAVNGYQKAAGNYIAISTARMGTLWKIGNNVSDSGQTVSPATSAGVYAVFNNN